MDFDETSEERAFRAEVIAFLDEYAPADDVDPWQSSIYMDDDAASLAYVESSKRWQGVKYEHGWAGITWPKEYGGRDGTGFEAGIFAEEESKRIGSSGVFSVGIGMAGPTLMVHGTEAQKDEYLDAMLRGQEVWCQLFSEPNAGSDLGGLRTSAVRDGDEWVVNGQKVWNSGAHYSDWGILLTRTDVEANKHRGITYFVVDMHSPGVECRPLRQITGGAEFNEVFFDDVRIPHENVIGEVNAGWGPMMTTLSNERNLIGGGGSRVRTADLIELARSCGRSDDPVARQDLMRVHTQGEILRFLSYRVRTATSRGEQPGPESSVLKLAVSENLEALGDLVLSLQGAAGMLGGRDAVDHQRWLMTFLGQWGARIGGGTDQIQRNTIGNNVLGLPPEPRVDKGIPFKDIPT